MNEDELKVGEMTLITTPDKRIPKLCTQVVFSLATDGKIILTFVYKENPEEDGVIIERVMLPNNEQAKQIIEKLNEVIGKSEKIIQEKK